MSTIAEKCREKSHHPEWANVRIKFAFFLLSSLSCPCPYRQDFSYFLLRRVLKRGDGLNVRGIQQVYQKTFIRWTTHRPDGLSIKDVEMAAVCDELGRLHGEVGGSVTDAFGTTGKKLVEAVKH